VDRNRLSNPAVLIFLVPNFWVDFLTLNPPSCTPFTALAKEVDRLLFCILQVTRKGLQKIRRFTSFPLTPLK